MQSLFRDGGINSTDINEREIIPFYDRTRDVEQAIYEFLKSTPPESKAKIMTLFDSPGTGKTILLSNLPMIYENVYRISISPRRIKSRIYSRKKEYSLVWSDIITLATRCVSFLNSDIKSVSIELLSENSNDLLDWSYLSKTVREKLGEDALVYLHIDAFQFFFDSHLLSALYSQIPCSKNVKMIVSGTTALGDEAIKCMSEFDTVACPPLKSFGRDRVSLILKRVLFWDELKFEGRNEEECREIKVYIEEALVGTPKCILYFLQTLSKFNATQLMKETELKSLLEVSFRNYSEKQKKMIDQLLEMGEHCKIKNTNLFERIVLIFTFPEDFGLERKEDVLVGDCNNEVIKLLSPFNHSGLVRIYKVSGLVYLSIPDNFTKRYIQEHTLYFPKEWLERFNSTCGTSKNALGNLKGNCIQMWLSIVLLNQHSILFETISQAVKRKLNIELIRIHYAETVKKNVFETFEQNPEDIDGPKISHDAKTNSCMDVILPIQVKHLHKSRGQKEVIPLFIQITSIKTKVSQHAERFFNRVSNIKSNKKDSFKSSIALFLTVHPLEGGKEDEAVQKYLDKNSSFLLICLDSSNIFKNTYKISDPYFLQKWIQKSNLFMDIANSESESLGCENWKDKSLSPYGDRSLKKRKPSNINSPLVQELSTSVLKRATGVLSIGDVWLDKNKPKRWTVDQVKNLLLDKDVGVGLDDEDIQDINLKGYYFETLVNALINFNGDEEAKINYGCHLLTSWQ